MESGRCNCTAPNYFTYFNHPGLAVTIGLNNKPQRRTITYPPASSGLTRRVYATASNRTTPDSHMIASSSRGLRRGIS